jgi:hypothetical protein
MTWHYQIIELEYPDKAIGNNYGIFEVFDDNGKLSYADSPILVTETLEELDRWLGIIKRDITRFPILKLVDGKLVPSDKVINKI